MFGPSFVAGADELRILIVGMIVPVMVGTVGFILIMAGRTGWDLLVYIGGFAIDVGLALALARPEVLGIRGAAIAQAVTLTISALARLFLVRRFLRIWPFDAWYLRLLVPTVLGGVVMYAVHLVLPMHGGSSTWCWPRRSARWPTWCSCSRWGCGRTSAHRSCASPAS